MKNRNSWSTAATLASAIALGAASVSTGCQSDPEMMSERDITFTLQSSAQQILVGETVTVIPRSRNLVARNADIKWDSTGGEIETEQNARVARVTFTEAGSFAITATLLVDGEEIRRDTVNVTVEPLS